MKQHKANLYLESYKQAHFKNIFQLPNSISSPHTSSNLDEYLVLPLRKNKKPPDSNVLPKVVKHIYAFRKADMYQQKKCQNYQNQVECVLEVIKLKAVGSKKKS